MNDFRVMLVNWKNKGCINETAYKKILTTDVLLRAYGTPKIHKEGNSQNNNFIN